MLLVAVVVLGAAVANSPNPALLSCRSGRQLQTSRAVVSATL